MNKHVKWYTAWITYDCGCTKAVNAFYGMVDQYGEETDLYKHVGDGEGVSVSRKLKDGTIKQYGQWCYECVGQGAEKVNLA